MSAVWFVCLSAHYSGIRKEINDYQYLVSIVTHSCSPQICSLVIDRILDITIFIFHCVGLGSTAWTRINTKVCSSCIFREIISCSIQFFPVYYRNTVLLFVSNMWAMVREALFLVEVLSLEVSKWYF